MTHLHPWVVNGGVTNLDDVGESYIPSANIPTIVAEMLAQCDPQDGVTDKIISQPYSCNFDATALLCNSTSTNTSLCLTAPQIDTLSLYYTDWLNSTNSSDFLFNGFSLGADPTAYLGVTDSPSHFGLEFLQGFIYNTTAWNWNYFSQQTVAFADSIDPGHANSMDTDLSAFSAAGGKVIHFHGLAGKCTSRSLETRACADLLFP